MRNLYRLEKVCAYAHTFSQPMKEEFVDGAVKAGNVAMTQMLTGSCKVCPSLEAIQEAIIKGQEAAAVVALGNCGGKLRDNKDIKERYYCKEGNTWSTEIPKEFQY